MQKKTVMFVVQGEGRGHLTQAISLNTILNKHNMELCCVVAGKSGRKELPAFFLKKFSEPVVTVDSPQFIKDKKAKSVRLWNTVINNLFRIPRFLRSICIINKLIKFHKPDLIINFYEPVFTLYQLFFTHKSRTISLAHQNIYLHEEFIFPEYNWWNRTILKQYTRFVSAGTDIILALSPYNLPQSENPRLQIIPPLLREEVLQERVSGQEFILIYMVNSGYMEEIIEWHLEHPEYTLHVFTDNEKVKTQENGIWTYDHTLCFHSLHDTKFIRMMAACRAVVTTAGFESICEAMYFGKPVLMVPVKGHYEQYCNARDGKKAGAGIFSDHFNITRLLNYLPFHPSTNMHYRQWVEKAEISVVQAITSLYPDITPSAPAVGIEVIRKIS